MGSVEDSGLEHVYRHQALFRAHTYHKGNGGRSLCVRVVEDGILRPHWDYLKARGLFKFTKCVFEGPIHNQSLTHLAEPLG